MGQIRFDPSSRRGVILFEKQEGIQSKATKLEILKENKGLSNISEKYPNPHAGCGALAYWLWFYASFVWKDQSKINVAKQSSRDKRIIDTP